jgi:hypothetical protein
LAAPRTTWQSQVEMFEESHKSIRQSIWRTLMIDLANGDYALDGVEGPGGNQDAAEIKLTISVEKENVIRAKFDGWVRHVGPGLQRHDSGQTTLERMANSNRYQKVVTFWHRLVNSTADHATEKYVRC